MIDIVCDDATTSHSLLSSTFSHHFEGVQEVLGGLQTDLIATQQDIESTSANVQSAVCENPNQIDCAVY